MASYMQGMVNCGVLSGFLCSGVEFYSFLLLGCLCIVLSLLDIYTLIFLNFLSLSNLGLLVPVYVFDRGFPSSSYVTPHMSPHKFINVPVIFSNFLFYFDI